MPNYFLTSNDDMVAVSGESTTVARDQSSDLGVGGVPWDTLYYPFHSMSFDYTHKALRFPGNAIYMNNYAYDFIYNRIWVTSLIEFGLISELSTGYVYIWNSNLTFSVALTSFTDPGDVGIQIDTVTVPTYITPNNYISYAVYVPIAGPAEQDTTYEWVVYGQSRETRVTATRLIPFVYDIDWVNDEDLLYEYFTSVYRAKTTHEQRRSMINSPIRKSTFIITLEKQLANHFQGKMRGSIGKYFVVPIYSEFFTTSTSLSGATTIIGNEDLTYYWNLQKYCDYILIVDHESRLVESKSISGIAGSTISLYNAVNKTFDNTRVVIYPAYVGVISNLTMRNYTSNIVRANISFQEVRANGV